MNLITVYVMNMVIYIIEVSHAILSVCLLIKCYQYVLHTAVSSVGLLVVKNIC